MLFLSCSHHSLSLEALENEVEMKTNETTKARITANDYPYSLALQQQSLNRFKEEQKIEEAVTLLPTHYAIQMCFDNWSDYLAVERDSSLIVLYHPFNYDYSVKPVGGDGGFETSNVSSHECMPDLMPDTIFDRPDTRNIEPLYIFWPIGKTLPDENYTICYSAFIEDNWRPNDYSQTDCAIIEGWLGHNSSSNDRLVRTGTVYFYDNSLLSYVPIRNAKILFSNGAKLNYAGTDSNGAFALPSWLGDYGSLTLCLDSDYFTVRDANNSYPVKVALGDISSLWANDTDIAIYCPYSFNCSVYNAAWYYYNGTNLLLNSITNLQTIHNHIDIHSYPFLWTFLHDIDDLGSFTCYPSSGTPPHINMYEAYSMNTSSKVFGIVLHEFGHASHYASAGVTNYVNSVDFIRESIADFFGWYNVYCYYSSLVSSHNDVNSLCINGRQNWIYYSPSDYTPLFVDLFDNYNQRNVSVIYNNDMISSIPVNDIVSLAFSSQNYNQLYSVISAYFLSHSLSDDFDDFFDPYTVFN